MLAIVLAFGLTGAGERPRVTLFTALPLMWGEGDAADVIAGRTRQSATLAAVTRDFDVRPIDTISAETLGPAVAIIAQPRRLTPQELVALDGWVRHGGRAMIFADPELVWPSRYPPGDARRAPPVTLLDPLLAHWGVTLGDSDGRPSDVYVDDATVRMRASGNLTGPANCSAHAAQVLSCDIGAGKVLLVGDADVLDERLVGPSTAENAAWIVRWLKALARVRSDPTQARVLVAGGLAAALVGGLALFYRRIRREHRRNLFSNRDNFPV